MSTPYYRDDHVTLWHGDCLEHPEWWTGADVLVTDPPYGYNATLSHGVGGKYGLSPWVGQPIANDDSLDARSAMLAAWGQRPALVFGSWKMPKPEGTHTVLTWDKGDAAGMGDLSVPWKPNTEEIYVIGKGFQGTRDSSILRAQVVTWASKGREHPNMKPVALMQALIAKCPPGTIADPFAGSGSTGVAAKALGRKAILVELEERYCEIAARRLSQDVLDFSGSAGRRGELNA